MTVMFHACNNGSRFLRIVVTLAGRVKFSSVQIASTGDSVLYLYGGAMRFIDPGYKRVLQ